MTEWGTKHFLKVFFALWVLIITVGFFIYITLQNIDIMEAKETKNKIHEQIIKQVVGPDKYMRMLEKHKTPTNNKTGE